MAVSIEELTTVSDQAEATERLNTTSNGDRSAMLPRKLDAVTIPAASELGNTQIPELKHLYSSEVVATIWKVALKKLDDFEPPTSFPEYTRPDGTTYIESPADFWTSGFFPGSLYLLLERQRKWPQAFSNGNQKKGQPHPLKLEYACRWWTERLHIQATATNTHDLGFLIQPWAQLGFELDSAENCLKSLITAAYSLASRFDSKVGCIRSWDTCYTKRYKYDDPSKDFLVIIDNMMNLDILYYVSKLNGDPRLEYIATSHAVATISAHIRDDDSTFHVVNFDQTTGQVKERFTNQGYSHDSCWSRGQAWGIAGFAQAYGWTKDERFLATSKRLADYFIAHLPDDFVPYWDFSAPLPGPRDTSAAMVAAYGLILLYEAESNSTRYLDAALRIIEAVIKKYCSANAIETEDLGIEMAETNDHETILLNATINNYEHAPKRYADHGLVYADYYFLLVGNKLLKMGLM
ncbi:putative glucuronyl hydrolase [Phaeomoniella chlamydospora]|uniref:Putative glucuronyl hydrolase n=1 Tax=Phaeomoniella chlamydospora TaxID=158046 RepID=A0A0G2DV09_PHACM|nr:putative glucuronyl hydrolase [Phaeomoniella chlamydospora]